MLRLALLVLLTTAASAQGPATNGDDPRTATVLKGVGIYAVGASAAVGSLAAGLFLVSEVAEGDEAALLLPAGAALGVTAATYGIGQALGVDGTLRGAIAGAALGAVPGTVLIGVALTIPDIGALGPAIAGMYLSVGLVPLGAFIGYGLGARRAVTITPATLVTPTGEAGAGLRLTVGLSP
ncbi:hypothetical protein [Rubrivirga sp.]|uniref:hypothetical protein n=1 Tax=Rubrivirga sp. TaxID=1885344 RepID=UPI003C77C6D9